MLHCHILHSPDQKIEVLKGYLSDSCYWIVNDLQTKFWMQSLLHEELKKVFNGDKVLRASELWLKTLLKDDPTWQILNPDLAQFFIEKWFLPTTQELKVQLSSRDRKKAYQTIGQILPLLSHSLGEESIEEWFAQSTEAKERWYDWYLVGKSLWLKFLDKKMIPSEWLKGLLVNLEIFSDENHSYVFDLGLDIDDVESELILNLSRIADVTVIIPDTAINLEAYENLLSRSPSQDMNPVEFLAEKTYKKLPSMLSEVKDAVAKVRQWLDEGVDPKKIAIISPIIENYWPTLSEYLLVEGVPVNKAVVTPLSQIEIYQTWLSNIRFAFSKALSVDGEQVLFSDVEEPILEYKQYQQYFKNVYSIEDFNRLDAVKKTMPKVIDPKAEVNFKTFLNWSVDLYPQRGISALGGFLQNFDEIYLIDERLSYEKWLEFLESYLARNEKHIEAANEEGIAVLSPAGGQNIPFEKMIFLGLSEDNLKDVQDTALHWTDIESIKIQFGFSLPHTDRNKTLLLIQWIEKKLADEMIYYHSETDFSGRFQSPSLYWLQGAIERNHNLEMEAPSTTRWDLILQNNPQEDLSWDEESKETIENFLKRDVGELPMSAVQLNHLSLSPSSLEEYFKCPFRFFAQKGLKLSDLPSLDLDIDYMTKGRLIHKICELLIAEKKWALSDKEIDGLIERAKKEIKYEVYNSELWSFFKPFYFQLTKRFIHKEVEWRNQHPETQTAYVERFLDTQVSIDGGFHFVKENGIPFRGIIDRVDKSSSNQYAVIDYKSGAGDLTKAASWLEKGRLQLFIYSFALIEGVLTGKSEEVVGAYYYILQTMDRTKGFATADVNPDFLDPEKKFTPEFKEQLFEEARNLLTQLIDGIIKGQFDPKPYKEEICKTCDWSKICRYPNLNH